MCGITGFTNLRRTINDAERHLRAMTATLQPRGPDGEGFHINSAIAMGHRRLSIIDIAGGAQPMSSPDGRYWITFNGEIYNYIELADDLRKRGHVFQTHSDTEVLLRQLMEFGPEGLDTINGMFAFAFWDSQKHQLLLARDRLGIKPLFYTVANGELVFASELKALLLHPDVRRKINPLSVSKYFSFGYIPAPHTIFEGIHKLEPGFWLRFDEKGIHKSLYWDIPFEDRPISSNNVDDCATELLELLKDSVSKQLRSDVPVGVFLSGGLDSSALTALAAQAAGKQIHTFSVGFEESSYDESPYAREVSKLYGTNHHHEVLSLKRAMELIPSVMAYMDEPFGDASILPTYLLSQFTARHVKVVLGGDGSDELFAGYPAFQAHKVMEKISFLPTTWRDTLCRLARRLPVSHRYASIEFLLQQFFKGAGISTEIRFFMWMGCFGNEQKRSLLSNELHTSLLRFNPFEDIINYVRQSGLVSDFERILYLCTKLYLQDDILVKVDRASMANSLEVRVPYLDHNLVEHAANIQPVHKLRGLTTKYILKKAVKDLLPKRIIHRRKAGFMIPLADWITKDMRDMVEDLCSPASLAKDGFFNPVYVRALLDQHFRHERDHRKLIWTLVAFQLWRRNYAE